MHILDYVLDADRYTRCWRSARAAVPPSSMATLDHMNRNCNLDDKYTTPVRRNFVRCYFSYKCELLLTLEGVQLFQGSTGLQIEFGLLILGLSS